MWLGDYKDGLFSANSNTMPAQDSIEEELFKLREEQRRKLAEDINDLKNGINDIRRDVIVIREQHARSSTVDELAKRIATLENDKAKIIGGFIALASLQGVIGFLIWIMNHAPTK